jgi:hypothetical protein
MAGRTYIVTQDGGEWRKNNRLDHHSRPAQIKKTHVVWARKGRGHRLNNLPAITVFKKTNREIQSQVYMVNGLVHRTDGPAIVRVDNNDCIYVIYAHFGYQFNCPLEWQSFALIYPTQTSLMKAGKIRSGVRANDIVLLELIASDTDWAFSVQGKFEDYGHPDRIYD